LRLSSSSSPYKALQPVYASGFLNHFLPTISILYYFLLLLLIFFSSSSFFFSLQSTTTCICFWLAQPLSSNYLYSVLLSSSSSSSSSPSSSSSSYKALQPIYGSGLLNHFLPTVSILCYFLLLLLLPPPPLPLLLLPLLLFLPLLLLTKRYNLYTVLACSTTFFQLSLFCATFFQLPMLMLFMPSKTSSSQRVLGLPIRLLDVGFHLLIFCTIHPSLGAQTTVSTACGTGQLL